MITGSSLISFPIKCLNSLGEISPNEFKHFIGKDMRLEPVIIGKKMSIEDIFFYTGKNTPERQEFIIENLRVERH